MDVLHSLIIRTDGDGALTSSTLRGYTQLLMPQIRSGIEYLIPCDNIIMLVCALV